MKSEITKIAISSFPVISVAGHPFLAAVIGGITGAFISLIGVIAVHQDSKKCGKVKYLSRKCTQSLLFFMIYLHKLLKMILIPTA